MPKQTRIDYQKITDTLLKILARGPLAAREACQYLRISQPTFSRMVARLSDKVLIVGGGSKTRYALKRVIPEVGQDFTIYTIDERGKTFPLGVLNGIYPEGFYFNAGDYTGEGEASRFYDDFPYFLDDLRPSGFLGRLVPQAHPQLSLPKNISHWSANDCLKYITQYGYDLIGNIILGDGAFNRYLQNSLNQPDGVLPAEREKEYPIKALQILQYGDPGSSAGGEQPKFPTVLAPHATPVLVKFSPKIDNEIAQRRADLLMCEHLALSLLSNRGHGAAKSTIIFGGNQVFLETERFDRVGARGRKGLISLNAINAEFVGHTGSWAKISRSLLQQRLISKEIFYDICWRETFGHLIGNIDMHPANISFYFQAGQILDLAPAYDMLPMLYAPQNEQIVEKFFNPPLPIAESGSIWKNALSAGIDFWNAVIQETRISSSFRKIARENLQKVQSLEGLQNLLP